MPEKKTIKGRLRDRELADDDGRSSQPSPS